MVAPCITTGYRSVTMPGPTSSLHHRRPPSSTVFRSSIVTMKFSGQFSVARPRASLPEQPMTEGNGTMVVRWRRRNLKIHCLRPLPLFTRPGSSMVLHTVRDWASWRQEQNCCCCTWQQQEEPSDNGVHTDVEDETSADKSSLPMSLTVEHSHCLAGTCFRWGRRQ